MKKQIIWVIAVLVFLSIACSGWIFSTVQNRNNAKEKELTTLVSAFNRQYGTDSITVEQVFSPEKVYVAVWTDKDSIAHISWNIGGLWVTVWNGEVPTTTTP